MYLLPVQETSFIDEVSVDYTSFHEIEDTCTEG